MVECIYFILSIYIYDIYMNIYRTMWGGGSWVQTLVRLMCIRNHGKSFLSTSKESQNSSAKPSSREFIAFGTEWLRRVSSKIWLCFLHFPASFYKAVYIFHHTQGRYSDIEANCRTEKYSFNIDKKLVCFDWFITGVFRKLKLFWISSLWWIYEV